LDSGRWICNRELTPNKRAALDPGPVAFWVNPKGCVLAGASDRERYASTKRGCNVCGGL
jgi:hypothetical protein